MGQLQLKGGVLFAIAFVFFSSCLAKPFNLDGPKGPPVDTIGMGRTNPESTGVLNWNIETGSVKYYMYSNLEDVRADVTGHSVASQMPNARPAVVGSKQNKHTGEDSKTRSPRNLVHSRVPREISQGGSYYDHYSYGHRGHGGDRRGSGYPGLSGLRGPKGSLGDIREHGNMDGYPGIWPGFLGDSLLCQGCQPGDLLCFRRYCLTQV